MLDLMVYKRDRMWDDAYDSASIAYSSPAYIYTNLRHTYTYYTNPMTAVKRVGYYKYIIHSLSLLDRNVIP